MHVRCYCAYATSYTPYSSLLPGILMIWVLIYIYFSSSNGHDARQTCGHSYGIKPPTQTCITHVFNIYIIRRFSSHWALSYTTQNRNLRVAAPDNFSPMLTLTGPRLRPRCFVSVISFAFAGKHLHRDRSFRFTSFLPIAPRNVLTCILERRRVQTSVMATGTSIKRSNCAWTLETLSWGRASRV